LVTACVGTALYNRLLKERRKRRKDEEEEISRYWIPSEHRYSVINQVIMRKA
jgi:hypothetical protein